MQCTYVFFLLIALTYIEIILSFDIINDDKFDEIQQIPSSLEKQANISECLSKNRFSKILNRDRRASISRSYFRHWQQTRDNNRHSVKNSLAFSPRLGKREYENENQLDKFVYRSIDLVTFVSHLREEQIDIVYEDSTKICLSQPINDAFLQQILDKVDKSRRNQDEENKEEIHGRQTKGKHPVLFRYRLG